MSSEPYQLIQLFKKYVELGFYEISDISSYDKIVEESDSEDHKKIAEQLRLESLIDLIQNKLEKWILTKVGKPEYIELLLTKRSFRDINKRVFSNPPSQAVS